MIFGTVCSGIGAPETAWKSLGWTCSFMSEIEPQARAVLAHHNEGVPCHGDFTTIQNGNYPGISVLCGGTPCQSFSVAGLRGGMADARGNLALEYLRLADRLRPRWLVWENVPGVLSSNGARDFGAFLGGLGQLGYGWAYRSLDAQFFNLAQRRERVFVVGYLGDWRRAAAVLFEPASLRGDTAPSREAGKGTAYDIAPSIGASGRGFNRAGDTRGQDCVVGTLLHNGRAAGSATSQNAHSGLLIAHSLRADGFDASEDGTGRGIPLVSVASPLTAGGHPNSNMPGRHREDDTNLVANALSSKWRSSPDNGADNDIIRPVAFDTTQITSKANRSNPQPGDPCHPLTHGGNAPTIASICEGAHGVTEMDIATAVQGGGGKPGQGYQAAITLTGVRRLTPLECLRLQGFPDDFFDTVTYKRKPLADGPRYRLIGNSMAVPVVRKIGERIARFDPC